MNNGRARVVRFGPFELDKGTGELRKHGIKVRLQGKPFQVLQALLESPGRIVGRDELQHRLWPVDTFVDFESGLNTATNRLRIALGDSAEKPLYIETLAKTGYRFVAPVEEIAQPLTTSRLRQSETKWALAALAVIGLLVSVAAFIGRNSVPAPETLFRQITFRRGQVGAARFLSGPNDIVYSAQWERGPKHVYVTAAVSPESRSLGFEGLSLISVSQSRELALMKIDGTLPMTGGTLFRVPMNGGSPLESEKRVMAADWSADGRQLAIVRATAGENRLEFPSDKVLYRTSGWLSSARVSRDNQRVAFFEHPVRHDDSGFVKIVDVRGAHQTLTERWSSAGGLAWHPSGKEIWFTAARQGGSKSVWAVTTSGKLRSVGHGAGILTLRDIARDGRLLVTRDSRRLETAGLIAGDETERDLSWLDWTRAADLSEDGSLMLFDESGEAAGASQISYLTRMSDRSTVRLGEARAMALSPDGKFALLLGVEDRTRLRLVPVTNGQARDIPPSGLEYQWVKFFPEGTSLLALANEPGKALRLYIVKLDPPANPRPITPPAMVRHASISPGGRQIAVLSAEGRLQIYPVNGGNPHTIPSDHPLAPVRWSRDGAYLYVQHLRQYTEIPTRVSRLDLASGRLLTWREFTPADPMGVNMITRVLISADERSYVYSFRRVLNELFVVDGWR